MKVDRATKILRPKKFLVDLAGNPIDINHFVGE